MPVQGLMQSNDAVLEIRLQKKRATVVALFEKLILAVLFYDKAHNN